MTVTTSLTLIHRTVDYRHAGGIVAVQISNTTAHPATDRVGAWALALFVVGLIIIILTAARPAARVWLVRARADRTTGTVLTICPSGTNTAERCGARSSSTAPSAGLTSSGPSAPPHHYGRHQPANLSNSSTTPSTPDESGLPEPPSLYPDG